MPTHRSTGYRNVFKAINQLSLCHFYVDCRVHPITAAFIVVIQMSHTIKGILHGLLGLSNVPTSGTDELSSSKFGCGFEYLFIGPHRSLFCKHSNDSKGVFTDDSILKHVLRDICPTRPRVLGAHSFCSHVILVVSHPDQRKSVDCTVESIYLKIDYFLADRLHSIIPFLIESYIAELDRGTDLICKEIQLK